MDAAAELFEELRRDPTEEEVDDRVKIKIAKALKAKRRLKMAKPKKIVKLELVLAVTAETEKGKREAVRGLCEMLRGCSISGGHSAVVKSIKAVKAK